MNAWRQLDLLKGPRQRGVKPPSAKEREVHIAIADTIKISIAPLWVIFHVPNGEYRKVQTGELLKRMLVVPGVSDFMCIGPPHGRSHALELKRKGKKPSETQYAWMLQVELAGGVTAWCDNYQDAIEILVGWGALKSNLRISV